MVGDGVTLLEADAAGDADAVFVGLFVGEFVGVGVCVGLWDGETERETDGVGVCVGLCVGLFVGLWVGLFVGLCVGVCVGLAEHVGIQHGSGLHGCPGKNDPSQATRTVWLQSRSPSPSVS